MKKIVNYLLLVTSITIALLLAEIGLRIVAYRSDLNTLENIGQTSNIPEPGERVSLGRIIQLSENPRVVYKLRPNLTVRLKNRYLPLGNPPITINGHGFRGDIIPIPRGPQTIRIVGIGDSVMFGWGVKDEETCLEVLSVMLNSRYPECSWEIINTAVPGYNTVMEVETLKEVGLAYKPDIVIINYVQNDLDLPNFIRDQEDYFAYNQSYLVKYTKRTVRQVKMIRAPRKSEGRGFESDPQKVPKQYQNMVGLEAYHAAMKELQVLSHKHKFEVVVLSHRKLPALVKEISSQLGFHLVETARLWKKYAAENHLNAETAWPLSSNDPHPSVIGHKIIAESLFNFLEEQLFTCQPSR